MTRMGERELHPEQAAKVHGFAFVYRLMIILKSMAGDAEPWLPRAARRLGRMLLTDVQARWVYTAGIMGHLATHAELLEAAIEEVALCECGHRRQVHEGGLGECAFWPCRCHAWLMRRDTLGG